jgi:hypothetical protein
MVARESASSGRYTIRQMPAVIQISAASRDEAVQIARRFAQSHAVDIWYQENASLRLLEAYRVERGVRHLRPREEG